VRVGVNVVELRRDRRQLSTEARVAVEGLLAGMARHFGGRATRPPPELLMSIDAALDAVATEPQQPAHRAALLGLVGVRRGLFPDSPPYRPSLMAPTRTALAA